jgi:hypothetical protein
MCMYIMCSDLRQVAILSIDLIEAYNLATSCAKICGKFSYSGA